MEDKSLALVDPGSFYLRFKDEIDVAIKQVLNSGNFILGSYVKSFETEFAKYVGCSYAVAVNSGTDAIELSIRSLGLSENEIVFVPALAPSAVLAAVARASAKSYILDVDFESLTVSPVQLEKEITNCRSVGLKPKAVLAVHINGMPCMLDELIEICSRNDIYLIEDCCQAHGSFYKGSKVGNFGIMSAFSFYPTKNLGALGDGGIILTNSDDLYQKLINLRQYGWTKRYISENEGYNSRMDEIQASVLSVKLKYLDAENAHRRHVAGFYKSALSDMDVSIQDQDIIYGNGNYHRFMISFADFDPSDLIKWLGTRKIESIMPYPQPLHLQAGFKHFIIGVGDLSLSERICRSSIVLPMGAHVDQKAVELVSEALRQYLKTL
jgi:dTDP-4-amino-4,6-dideoxygalactose transaminase